MRELYYNIYSRIIQHVLLWGVFIALAMVVLVDRFGFAGSLMFSGAKVLAYWLVVYPNILWLIPSYLQKGKYLFYITGLVFFSIVSTLAAAYVEYFYFYYMQNVDIGDRLGELLLSTHLTIWLIIALTTALKFMKAYFYQRQEKEELEKEKLQAELRFLKSQINPHFLFNTLNNLYSLSLKKSDDAPEMVLKLSEMMRYMLYESNEKLVTLEKELNCVRNYIDLEKIRQGEQTNISLDIIGKVNGQQIAPLIFIPFLENGFKHGINKTMDGGWINIELKVDEQQLEMTVSNSKPPANDLPAAVDNNSGIGLKNVSRRLELLYPNRHQLDIEDATDTYTTHLKLDLS